jgi:hypothetical protein
MEIGLQALNRDGLNLGALTPYPLRADDKPRAVWPDGLTHLPAAPLVLEGEEAEPDDDGPARDIPGFEGLSFPSIRAKP